MKLFSKFFNNSYSLLEKGIDYLFGLKNKSVNIKTAYEFFVLSAEMGNSYASQILQKFFKPNCAELNDDFKEKYPLLKQLKLDVEKGDPQACFLWGIEKLNEPKDSYLFKKGLDCMSKSALKGFPKAKHVLGILMLKGQKVRMNKEKGLLLLKEAAEAGNIESIKTLYLMGDKDYALSLLLKESENSSDTNELIGEIYKAENKNSEALKYFEKAASQGNKDGIFNTALMYDKGMGIPKDKLMAAKWYKLGADNGDPMCMVNLGYILECGPKELHNPVSAFEWYLKAAESGYTDAWNNVGICFKHGIGVPQSLDRAVEAYTKAIAGEDPTKSYFNLFLLYTDGIVGKYDETKAFENLLKAADLNLPIACWHLALRYIIGLGVEKNIKMGLDWLIKAAHLQYPQAINDAMSIKEDVNLKKHQIAYNYLISNNNPSPEAIGKLGHYYSNGWGCPRNIEKAFECYRKAADANDPEALYDLGVCYRQGESVTQDNKKAFEYYERAARQGHLGAILNLGVFYEYGIAIEKNESKALAYYKEAAEKGNKDAQFCLGNMFFCGRYVDQNYHEAVKWFFKAAEQGEPDSIFHLGICRLKGLGLQKDIQKGIDTIYQAAQLGWTPAMDFIVANNL